MRKSASVPGTLYLPLKLSLRLTGSFSLFAILGSADKHCITNAASLTKPICATLTHQPSSSKTERREPTLIIPVLECRRHEPYEQLPRALALQHIREQLRVYFHAPPQHDKRLHPYLVPRPRSQQKRLRKALRQNRKRALEEEVEIRRAMQLGEVEPERVRSGSRGGGRGVLGEENGEEVEARPDE